MLDPIRIPEAGADAILTFSYDDLERLGVEAERRGSKNGWWRDALTALDEMDVPAIRRLLIVGLKGGDPDAALRALPVMEIAGRVLDALMYRVWGRSAEEQEFWQLEQAKKRATAKVAAMMED